MSRQNKTSEGPLSLNASQKNGTLLLIPLILVVSVILFFVKRPASKPVEPPVVADSIIAVNEAVVADTISGIAASSEPFYFDPNTADLRTFMSLGLTRRTAAGIIKYRDKGKVFEIKEDFATCYGLSDEDYFRLEPYIRIGEKYRSVKPSATVAARDRSSENERTESSGYVAKSQGKPSKPAKVNLNSADSALLRSVRGVGAYTVVEIIKYRDLLGGFTNVDQLSEVRGVREENMSVILPQIYVDSCDIQKIDVNFASQQQINDDLSAHPYAGPIVVRKLLKIRQLKGGWRTITDMVEDEILTKQEAERLAPYLVFIHQ